MAYDIDAIRAHFPALAEGAAHFDGPGGSQTPDVVARAVADTLMSAIANRGSVTRAEQRAEQIVQDARTAMGDLLAVDPRGVVFGRSATDLTFHLAGTLAADWGPGDEVVVSRMDHDCNIRPWVHAAKAAGATVRWIDFEASTGELTVDHVTAVLSERTRLVALTAASNLIGTRPDLTAVAELVHRTGALFYVDGVHATAHALVDFEASGADFWVCSPYKFLGPHCGVLAAHPATLEALHPDKLLPSSNAVPDRFELGTLPYELLAGTTAAVDFLSQLAAAGSGSSTRRERIVTSLGELTAHEDSLMAVVEPALRALPGVTVHSNAKRRTPTLLFTARGHEPQEIYRALAERGINAPASNFYAWDASHHLGLGDAGGVRIGLAPYTNRDDIDRLIGALQEILPC
ncbi:cysteine desulfurase-like protein [Leekyejoonella antrihumi]|uniref:Cysteine desulfurase-like protein n=1 Tax=Leekyejoonella antrihumi TaxID=1660198 RepID=A0A563E7M1_9MICO|nr:cysteine desulfurase-like protein [Leekyejoonella antrihumi]TWP38201.1 cysteine desulfurase-like protein [Leekyejoonella antrihumi]